MSKEADGVGQLREIDEQVKQAVARAKSALMPEAYQGNGDWSATLVGDEVEDEVIETIVRAALASEDQQPDTDQTGDA